MTYVLVGRIRLLRDVDGVADHGHQGPAARQQADFVVEDATPVKDGR